MSTDMTWQTVSTSSEQTEQLGAAIGAKLRGGEVLELVSDLGGGKTTFTRGLARGAGSLDAVGSPTFTINREYKTPTFAISHFDFYRLGEAGIVAEELAEVASDPNFVTVVEWGDIVRGVVPNDCVTVHISLSPDSDTDRVLTFAYPESRKYIFEGTI